jgi:hypothetical protein
VGGEFRGWVSDGDEWIGKINEEVALLGGLGCSVFRTEGNTIKADADDLIEAA